MSWIKLGILFLGAVLCGRSNVATQPKNLQLSTSPADESEVTVAVDPRTNQSQHQIATWNQSGGGYSKVGWRVTTNGWSSFVSGILGPPPAPHNEWNFGFDPSTAIDNSGKIYLGYCAVSSLDPEPPYDAAIYVAYSTNDGISWNWTRVSSGLVSLDKPWISVSPEGEVFVTWTDYSDPLNTRLMYRYSTDGGTTFLPSAGDLVLYNYGNTNGCQQYPSQQAMSNQPLVYLGMPVSVGGSSVNVAFTVPNGVGQGGEVRFMSAGQYTNFDPQYGRCITNIISKKIVLGSNMEIYPIPSLAVNPTNGYMYMAVSTASSANTNDWKIKFARSTDAGLNWTTKIIADMGSGIQVFPWVSIDANGVVTVSFMHSQDTRNVNAYLIKSYDNGQTFQTAQRISSQTTDPAASYWSHHYMGVTSTASKSYPIWTDYRNGSIASPNSDIYVGIVDNQQSSSLSTATKWGQSKKIVYGTDNSLHYIFREGSDLWYMLSTDQGGTWLPREKVSGFWTLTDGSNPSIALDGNNKAHVVWGRNGSGVYYNRRTTGSWGSPILIRTTNSDDIWPSFMIQSGSSTGHVAWLEYYVSGGPTGPQQLGPGTTITWYVKHGTFNITSPSPSLTNTTLYSTTLEGQRGFQPTLALSGSSPHVAWVAANDIFYRYKAGISWQPAVNVSNTAANSALPSLLSYGINTYVAWQEEVEVPPEGQLHQIFYSEKVDGEWMPPTAVTPEGDGANVLYDAVQPFIVGFLESAPLLVWSQRTLDDGDPFPIVEPFKAWYRHAPLSSATTSKKFANTSPSALGVSAATKQLAPGLYKSSWLWTEPRATSYQASWIWDEISLGAAKVALYDHDENKPHEYRLLQNYPNPFNPSTTINYSVPREGRVRIVVFDLLGREIATVADGFHHAGTHEVVFDGSNIASGIYFYRLTAGRFADTKKLVLLR